VREVQFYDDDRRGSWIFIKKFFQNLTLAKYMVQAVHMCMLGRSRMKPAVAARNLMTFVL
jgi:hypothetical protein